MDLGALLHLLGGAGLLLFAVSPLWAQVLLILAFGVTREIRQHDFSLTPHQWTEALAWPVGAILAALVLKLSA